MCDGCVFDDKSRNLSRGRKAQNLSPLLVRFGIIPCREQPPGIGAMALSARLPQAECEQIQIDATRRGGHSRMYSKSTDGYG